jgi:hypothetical protein
MKSLNEKKHSFCKNKVMESFNLCEHKHNKTIDDLYAELAELKIGISGFTVIKDTFLWRGKTENIYEIINVSGNGCKVQFITIQTKKRSHNEVRVDFFFDKNYLSSITNPLKGWDWTISGAGLIYNFLAQLENIEKECRTFEAEEERKYKEEERKYKLRSIAQNSIQTWIKAILKDTSYAYYTDVKNYKITLSIRLKNNMQLNIPIYYKSFQKIIPEILTTIKQYENTVNNGKIKVLIANSSRSAQWIKGVSHGDKN